MISHQGPGIEPLEALVCGGDEKVHILNHKLLLGKEM